jgi:hypothetical protein
MTIDELRDGVNQANRDDAICFVLYEGELQIAVGLDSGRQLAILHPKIEAPIHECTPYGWVPKGRDQTS